jgi:hypothetical protein
MRVRYLSLVISVIGLFWAVCETITIWSEISGFVVLGMFMVIGLLGLSSAYSVFKVIEFHYPLKPGRCECGHRRCSHAFGRGVCTAIVYIDEPCVCKDCACRIYIQAELDTPEDVELQELRKMANLK